MDSGKKTKRHLKQLNSELGDKWDTPKNSRRNSKASPSTGDKAQPPEPTTTPTRTPLPTSRPKTGSSTPDNPATMSSRGNQRRGPNRNSEVSEQGEEVGLWKEIKEKLPGIVDTFNESSANTIDIRDQEKRMAEKKEKGCKFGYPISPPNFFSFIIKTF